MKNYFLTGARIGFREWHETDLDLALKLWGDPEVTKLIGGPFSQEQVQAKLSREIATAASDKIQYWPIFLLENDEHIGCCGLRPYKPKDNIAEIGFHLRKAHWGHGYAKEAALTTIRFAFEKLGFEALFAGHNPANETSKLLLGKLGFQYTHDEYYAPTGLNHPSYILTRDDFKGTKKAAQQTNAPDCRARE